tara:strand:+ start:457 stop:669 length:213 start_codon:yes stop_codon:yes gene_type:complete
MPSTEVTYASRIETVNRLVGSLQTCDDVEEAIKMYEEAETHLSKCEQVIESAKGRYEEITSKTKKCDAAE